MTVGDEFAARGPEELDASCQEAVGPWTTYLPHFDQPYQTATGLRAGLAEHDAGRGGWLLQVARDAGISWRLARAWPGGRQREQQLKTRGGASRRCLQCGVRPRTIPTRYEEKITMRKPPSKSTAAADTGRRRPDYVIELAVNPDLRDRARRAAAARAQTSQAQHSTAAEPDPDTRHADREAEP